ncbi:hypothetical protein [Rheinheimera sp.]|uniref:hypothetical protein n=1 Tax=Rheinheimera sp. TaxID=1869214 RepID=UPI004047CF28
MDSQLGTSSMQKHKIGSIKTFSWKGIPQFGRITKYIIYTLKGLAKKFVAVRQL